MHTSIGHHLLLDMMYGSRLACSYSQGLHTHTVKACVLIQSRLVCSYSQDLHAHVVKVCLCSDDWKLLWSFRDPFYAHHPSFEFIKAMKPGQKVGLSISHYTCPLSESCISYALLSHHACLISESCMSRAPLSHHACLISESSCMSHL